MDDVGAASDGGGDGRADDVGRNLGFFFFFANFPAIPQPTVVPHEGRRPNRESRQRPGRRGRLSDGDDGMGRPWAIDLHKYGNLPPLNLRYHGGTARELVDARKLAMLAKVTRCHVGTGGRKSHGLAKAPPFRCHVGTCRRAPLTSEIMTICKLAESPRRI